MIKQTEHSDIIVIGGGLSGLTQSLLLAQAGLNVICLDQSSLSDQINSDPRTTAISYGSSQIFDRAGLWTALEPLGCPIRSIDILSDQSPVLLDFQSDDIKMNGQSAPFGWVFDNKDLRSALTRALQLCPTARHFTQVQCISFDRSNPDSVTVFCNDEKKYSARLIIGADGRTSLTRQAFGIGAMEWTYAQTAIVSIITHDQPHHHNAVEHFKPEGPFAILPYLDDRDGSHRSAVVWSYHAKDAQKFVSDDTLFLAAMRARIPSSYGAILRVTPRALYPLGFIHAYDYGAPRMALIADAAHGIHPIAGQGLNIGLRDVSCLTNLLQSARNNGQDIGHPDILATYQRMRRPDNTAMAIGTDQLNRLFSNPLAPVHLARKAGLRLVQSFRPAKKFFMKTAMGVMKA